MTASETARRRFQTVVLPHLDEAYSFAKGLARSGSDAEDIVQDACLRALAALETQHVEQPRAWLLTIVRNVAYSFFAHKNPRILAETDVDELVHAREPAPDAEALVIAAEDDERLRQALAELPLALRETLLMRTVSGLSYRDIAAATGAPLGTVMSRLARARKTLASIMGGDR